MSENNQQFDIEKNVYSKLRDELDEIGIDVPAWGSLPKYEKENFIFLMDKVELTPGIKSKELHNAFVKKQMQTGWMPGKMNGNDKTHPFIVSYESLPKERIHFYEELINAPLGIDEEE